MTDTPPGADEFAPEITVQMTAPTRGDGEATIIRLRIFDERSRIQLFELEMSPADVVDLLGHRIVRPTISQASVRLDAVGYEQTMWTERFHNDAEREALAFRAALSAQGWAVTTGPLVRTNEAAARFVVTGRRWDGQQAGTYCRDHRRVVLAGHLCYECAVGGTDGSALRPGGTDGAA